MIWIMGDQLEARLAAMEVGLLEDSWARLYSPHQLLGWRRPTVVVLESSFEWPTSRFSGLTQMMQNVGAITYHERDLREGKVPL